MKCAGCQQEIEGMSFESPWGPLCLACHLQHLQAKTKKSKNHPWLAALVVLGVIIILFFAYARLTGGRW